MRGEKECEFSCYSASESRCEKCQVDAKADDPLPTRFLYVGWGQGIYGSPFAVLPEGLANTNSINAQKTIGSGFVFESVDLTRLDFDGQECPSYLQFIVPTVYRTYSLSYLQFFVPTVFRTYSLMVPERRY